VEVNQPLTYALTYTLTEGRNWRELVSLQVRIRHDQDTILWLEFDPSRRTFSLIDPDTGAHGPAFELGRPNLLETSAATVYLADSRVDTGVPNPSSVTLRLAVRFKPRANRRIYNVEVVATDQATNSQGPTLVGRLQVGNVSSGVVGEPPNEESPDR
jgi:hypothetical protein